MLLEPMRVGALGMDHHRGARAEEAMNMQERPSNCLLVSSDAWLEVSVKGICSLQTSNSWSTLLCRGRQKMNVIWGEKP